MKLNKITKLITESIYDGLEDDNTEVAPHFCWCGTELLDGADGDGELCTNCEDVWTCPDCRNYCKQCGAVMCPDCNNGQYVSQDGAFVYDHNRMAFVQNDLYHCKSCSKRL